ncbi:MAG TPA: hypothetical protein VNJ04_10525 [Gemmatimonadaceae bacterium]|nr:hypothetical protein [Gemmatimonadaceae bacterium]
MPTLICAQYPRGGRGKPSRWQTRARKLEETAYRAATVVMGSVHTSS